MTAKRDGDFRQGAMTAAALDQQVARKYLTLAEDFLAKQSRRSVEDNRPNVARKLDTSVSTVSNTRRGRNKIVPAWFKEKIIRLFIQAAQNEMMAIEHEIEVARQIGLGNGDSALIAARARASALVTILDGVVTEGAGAGQQ